jgi:hypothetical protein
MPDGRYLPWPVFTRSGVAGFDRSLTVVADEGDVVAIAKEPDGVVHGFSGHVDFAAGHRARAVEDEGHARGRAFGLSRP